MRASARIVAEAGGRLPVLKCESPLLIRRTGPIAVHLVGGAAGPLRGDELRLEIEVGPGARLDVRSVAASLALPGRPGPPSRLEITATVGPGGWLRWWPEPLIAARGCDHRAVTHVAAADGATLIWRDDLVCGRHGEESGDVRTDTTVRYAGSMLYRHELAVGPAAPGWSSAAVLGRSDPAAAVPGRAGAAVPGRAGAAVLGGGRAVGTVLLAGPDLPEPALPGGDAALMRLAGPGMLGSAVGADIRDVRAVLDPLCGA